MQNIVDQKIIDAHHHFWDIKDNKHSWLNKSKNKNFNQSYLPDDLLVDSYDLKLIKTVHIQGEIDRKYSLYETEWLQKISDSRIDKFPNAIIAYIDLSSKNLEQTIENHKKFKNFRGIRQILRFDKNSRGLTDSEIDYLNNETWVRNMAQVEKHNLIFELLCYYTQYEDVHKLIYKYQNTKFIINHTLWPYNVDQSKFRLWKNSIDSLSEFPNTFIKLSGFGEIFPNWTKDTLHPFIDYTINKFGVSRCIFASNFPVDKFTSISSYKNYWQSYLEIVKDFSSDEINRLFYKNAEEFYEI